jgi:hypothetical protein
MKQFLQWLTRLFAVRQPDPTTIASIDQAREEFAKAYNDHNYAILCDLFHENAKFRGSVYPERWTFSRDRIITERYMSTETCTAIKAGATAQPREGSRSVGSMTLSLQSRRVTPIDAHYAADIGAFRMVVQPGSEALPTAGPYFLLWRKEGDKWAVIHMDMQP